MYEVIETYGDFEPWWFLDGWEKEVTYKKEFSTIAEAEKFFLQKVQEFNGKFAETKAKDQYLVAFWNKDELRWCEECDDDLQQYQGLLLLKDGKQLNQENNKKDNEIRGRVCPLAH